MTAFLALVLADLVGTLIALALIAVVGFWLVWHAGAPLDPAERRPRPDKTSAIVSLDDLMKR